MVVLGTRFHLWNRWIVSPLSYTLIRRSCNFRSLWAVQPHLVEIDSSFMIYSREPNPQGRIWRWNSTDSSHQAEQHRWWFSMNLTLNTFFCSTVFCYESEVNPMLQFGQGASRFVKLLFFSHGQLYVVFFLRNRYFAMIGSLLCERRWDERNKLWWCGMCWSDILGAKT